MKNLITKTVLLLALLLAAGHARAVVLFSDNFNSYADGALPLQPTVSSATWTNHSGTGGMVVNGGALYLGQNYQSDISTALAGQPYISNNGNPATGTNVFYLSFTVNFQNLPTNSGGFYFAHFKDGASNFKCRLYALTNNAATGNFRLGIANAQGTAAATNLTDLSLGVTYTVVMRYFTPTNNFAPITSTLWINPTSESSTSITAADSTSLSQVNYVAFRQPGGGTSGLTAGGASMAIDNLIVGTSFADVVSGSFNAPVALVQPSDTNVFASSGATFSTFSVGDAGIKYQWYYNTNTLLSDSATVVGSTSNVLTLSSLLVSQSGTYSCVA
ncbi:MAG TPA: immunoglobulin domain-containing protein, partial [Verrucomicrobiae bacterium]